MALNGGDELPDLLSCGCIEEVGRTFLDFTWLLDRIGHGTRPYDDEAVVDVERSPKMI